VISDPGNGNGGAARPSTTGRLRILIVDDDAELRHALGLLFEYEGYDVLPQAANGLEAITLARRYRPGVIVLDYRMPHLNGEEAAKLIRTVAPEARIVAFSAILDHAPDWADAYLNKDRIAEIAPLIDRLIRPLREPAPSA
jgi:CheY-like chemotaxis protein